MAKYKQRSDGRYEKKVSLGYDENGKLIRKSVMARGPRELERKVDEIKATYRETHLVKDAQTTVKEYSLAWFRGKALKSINTKAMYSNLLDRHIFPAIGHMQIRKVNRSDIEDLILKTSNRPETCKKLKMTLKQIFESAIDDGLRIGSYPPNPAAKVPIPKVIPTVRKRPLTELEKTAILKADFSPMERAFVYILFYFGIRREEALALTVADIDFTDKMMTINKAVCFDKNDPIIKEPKSSAGYRRIPIPDEITLFLGDYVLSCNEYLFTMGNGAIISQSSYTKLWRRIISKMNDAVMSEQDKKRISELKKANMSTEELLPIRKLTAHLFRHNYATMLYYSNISVKKAAELMGHSDINMILRVYAHIDDDKERAAEKINETIKLF